MLTKADAEYLDDLIDRYELAAEAGRQLTPEQLCDDAPHLLPHLVSSLGNLRQFDARMAAAPRMPVPDFIGEFDVISVLGAGGTGVVFLCRQTQPERHVAVKVLKPILNDHEQTRRFQKEMAVVSSIRDEGLAEVYQTGFTDWCGARCLWIAMEYLPHGTIVDFVRSRSMSREEILNLFRQVCVTLRNAHRLGILHRDIKPSNILVSAEDQPHLVDFGLASLPESSGIQRTATNAGVHGTAAWTAPELLQPNTDRRADTRTEIFSLGLVLFEMLTGRHPYFSDYTVPAQVAVRIAQGEQTSFRSLYSDASADLDAVIRRLTAHDADQRYQNLDEVLEDLDRLRRGDPVRLRRVPLTESVVRWSRRHRTAAAAMFVTVCSLLIAGLVLWRSAGEVRDYADRLETANSELTQQKSDLQQRQSELTTALALRNRSISSARLKLLHAIMNNRPAEVQRALQDPASFPLERRKLAWNLLNNCVHVRSNTLFTTDSPVQHLMSVGDERWLLAVCRDKSVVCYDFETESVRTLNVSVSLAPRPINLLRSPRVLLVSEDRKLVEVDCSAGDYRREYPQPEDVGRRFVASPDWKTAAGVTTDQRVFVLNLVNGKVILGERLQNAIAGIWFEGDGKSFHIVDRNGRPTRWETKTGKQTETTLWGGSAPFASAAPARYDDAEYSVGISGYNVVGLSQGNGSIHLFNADEPSVTPFRTLVVRDGRLRQFQFVGPHYVLSVAETARIHSLANSDAPEEVAVGREQVTAACCLFGIHEIAVSTTDGAVITTPHLDRTPRLLARHLTPFAHSPEDLGF
ncbi:MAG: protein kinase, partial [Planctomycetaceae bacterium]|nr:protein kinase [Planctomycetaceae bacterium]